MVEHAAVNRVVVGSSPTFGAIISKGLRIKSCAFDNFSQKASPIRAPFPIKVKRDFVTVVDFQLHPPAPLPHGLFIVESADRMPFLCALARAT